GDHVGRSGQPPLAPIVDLQIVKHQVAVRAFIIELCAGKRVPPPKSHRLSTAEPFCSNASLATLSSSFVTRGADLTAGGLFHGSFFFSSARSRIPPVSYRPFRLRAIALVEDPLKTRRVLARLPSP